MRTVNRAYVKQERQLTERHPELLEMEVTPLDESGLHLEELSGFMESCWTHDYGREPRLRFSRTFLAWNMGERLTGLMARDVAGKLVGVVVYFKRGYQQDGTVRYYAIETGLSVHPDCRGRGIGQWLVLRLRQMIREAGIDFSISWYDSRHNQPGSSFLTLAEKRSREGNAVLVTLLGRVMDYAGTVQYGGFSPFERAVLRLTSAVFPYVDSPDLPVKFRVNGWSEKKFYRYLDLVAEVQSCTRSGLAPDAGSFLRWGRGGRFYALEKRSEKNGRVYGLFFGHKVLLENNRFYFQADGIFLSPELSLGEKSAFLRYVEQILCEKERCIGVTVSETGGNPGWYHGYLPVASQVLSMDAYRPTSVGLNRLKAGFVELR
ncbi:MAG: GNAT family N-acetyltransferase [Desulfobacterales bacterium]|nr:GNAT family N-acetyltransferase [Desulfobacterales bacterium]